MAENCSPLLAMEALNQVKKLEWLAQRIQSARDWNTMGPAAAGRGRPLMGRPPSKGFRGGGSALPPPPPLFSPHRFGSLPRAQHPPPGPPPQLPPPPTLPQMSPAAGVPPGGMAAATAAAMFLPVLQELQRLRQLMSKEEEEPGREKRPSADDEDNSDSTVAPESRRKKRREEEPPADDVVGDVTFPLEELPSPHLSRSSSQNGFIVENTEVDDDEEEEEVKAMENKPEANQVKSEAVTDYEDVLGDEQQMQGSSPPKIERGQRSPMPPRSPVDSSNLRNKLWPQRRQSPGRETSSPLMSAAANAAEEPRSPSSAATSGVAQIEVGINPLHAAAAAVFPPIRLFEVSESRVLNLRNILKRLI